MHARACGAVRRRRTPSGGGVQTKAPRGGLSGARASTRAFRGRAARVSPRPAAATMRISAEPARSVPPPSPPRGAEARLRQRPRHAAGPSARGYGVGLARFSLFRDAVPTARGDLARRLAGERDAVQRDVERHSSNSLRWCGPRRSGDKRSWSLSERRAARRGGSPKTAGTADRPPRRTRRACVKNAAKSASSASAPRGTRGAPRAESPRRRSDKSRVVAAARAPRRFFQTARSRGHPPNAAARRATRRVRPGGERTAGHGHAPRQGRAARGARPRPRARKSQRRRRDGAGSAREPRDARRRRRTVDPAARLGCTPERVVHVFAMRHEVGGRRVGGVDDERRGSSRGAVDARARNPSTGARAASSFREPRDAPAVPFLGAARHFPRRPRRRSNRRAHALYASAPYAGSSASTSHVTFTTAPTGAHANAFAASPAAQARKRVLSRAVSVTLVRCAHASKTGVVTSGASRGGGTAARVASAASRSSARFGRAAGRALCAQRLRSASVVQSLLPIGQAEARRDVARGACLALALPAHPRAFLLRVAAARASSSEDTPPRSWRPRARARDAPGLPARRRPRQRHRSVGLFRRRGCSAFVARRVPSPRRPRPLRRPMRRPVRGSTTAPKRPMRRPRGAARRGLRMDGRASEADHGFTMVSLQQKSRARRGEKVVNLDAMYFRKNLSTACSAGG